MLIRLVYIVSSYDALRYEKIYEIDMEYYKTDRHIMEEPSKAMWRHTVRDMYWGRDWETWEPNGGMWVECDCNIPRARLL